MAELFEVFTDPRKLSAAARDHEALGEHLWLVIVSFGLTKEEAARGHEGIQMILDHHHVLNATDIGCYICEQPYKIVAAQPCKGSPTGYEGGSGRPVYKDGTRG